MSYNMVELNESTKEQMHELTGTSPQGWWTTLTADQWQSGWQTLTEQQLTDQWQAGYNAFESIPMWWPPPAPAAAAGASAVDDA